jgi:hypothetical protein
MDLQARPSEGGTTVTVRNLIGRATVITALAATSLALVASPASARYSSYELSDGDAPTIERTVNTQNTPVDENGKHYCSLANPQGGSVYVKHGDTIKVTVPGSGDVGPSTLTYKCNDGKFEPVALVLDPSKYDFKADHAYVEASGALVLANADQTYTHSTSAGLYSQP